MFSDAILGHAVVREVVTEAYIECDAYSKAVRPDVTCYPTAPVCPKGRLQNKYLRTFPVSRRKRCVANSR